MSKKLEQRIMEKKIDDLIKKQKDFFGSGKTLNISYRKECLKAFDRTIKKYEDEIYLALKVDLKKHAVEAFGADLLPIKTDLKFLIKNLNFLTKAQKVGTPLFIQPGSAKIQPHPYGVCAIISPFNYPFDLSFTPAAGAIAAGNTVILKPSEFTPRCTALIKKIVSETFDEGLFSILEGGPEEARYLTSQNLDYIFFTGSSQVGKKVMEQAAQNLTPISLELGGKNPCIVDKDADLNISAQRIAWAKIFNAGQSCVVPDFVYVQQDIKHEFIAYLKKAFKHQLPSFDPNEDYARIVNKHHFQRILSLFNKEEVLYGGRSNPMERVIEPTILCINNWDHPAMKEEIFGPVIPILEYENIDTLMKFLNSKPRPLALYYFSSSKRKQEKVIKNACAGGISINDTMAHIQNRKLPFGGVGNSGMGYYHGEFTFRNFTHYKAVQKRGWKEVPLKYPPYKGKFKLLKKILHILN
ncbi:MAG: aldehyde dehydrogenase family protein [Bacteroidales bacterium]